MCDHWYPTKTCGRSNPTVRSPFGSLAEQFGRYLHDLSPPLEFRRGTSRVEE